MHFHPNALDSVVAATTEVPSYVECSRPTVPRSPPRFGPSAVTSVSPSLGDLVDDITDLDRPTTRAAAIDVLYQVINERLLQQQWRLADRIVEGLDAFQVSPELRIAVLTITLPAASKLSSRQAFVRSTMAKLTELGRDPKHLLRGLI